MIKERQTEVAHFHNLGKRAYQEDAFYISADHHCLIVCDGVGGRAKGSTASKTIVQYLQQQYQRGELTDEVSVRRHIRAASSHLVDLAKADSSLSGMATTIAMVLLQDDHAIVAHVGDSRVYFVDPTSDEVWFTKDHSLVQELFDSGVLTTRSQMKTHPLKNRITRALTSDLSDLEAAEPASISTIEQVSRGSLFLLCTDGVLEQVDDRDIVNFLRSNDLREGIELLNRRCQLESSDNNTCIALRV